MSNVSGAVKAIQDIMRKDVGVDGDAQRIGQMAWMFFLKIYDDREEELELTHDDFRSSIPEKYRWRNWARDREGITGDTLVRFVEDMFFVLKNQLPTIGESGRRAQVIRDTFEDANNFMKSGTLTRQVINKINEIDFNNTQDRHTFGAIYEQILKDLQSAGNAGEFYTPRAVTRFIIDRLAPRLEETILDPACGTGGFLTCAIDYKRQFVKTPDEEARLHSTIVGVEKKQLPHTLCVTNMILHGIDTPNGIRHGNTLERPYRDYGEKDRVPVIATNPPFGGMEQDGIEQNFPSHLRTRETADLFVALIIKLLKTGGRAAVVLPDGFLFGEGVKNTLKRMLIEECDLHTIVRLPNGVFNPYTGIKTNILFFTKGRPTKRIWFYEHPYPEGAVSYNKSRPMRFEEFESERAWWGEEADGFLARRVTEQAWSITAEEAAERGYNLDLRNPHRPERESHEPAELLVRHAEQQANIQSFRDQIRTILAEALGTLTETAGRTDAVSMVSDHLDVWTPATERKASNGRGSGRASFYGVDRLRELILVLAVRGRLVPQCSTDEPASKLLARISESRGSTPRRTLRQISASESPGAIDLPAGWVATPLHQLAEPQAGFAFKSIYFNDAGVGMPLIRIRDVGQPFSGTYYSGDYRDEFLVQNGEYLVSMDGEFRVSSWPGETALLNQRVSRLIFSSDELAKKFVAIALQQELFKLQGMKAYTTVDHLSGKQIASAIIRVPPVGEQHRIVNTVDELMALCDSLETCMGETEATKRLLADAIIERAAA